jgi:hypothetical protein
MEVANTPAYYNKATIMTIEAPVEQLKHYTSAECLSMKFYVTECQVLCHFSILAFCQPAILSMPTKMSTKRWLSLVK